MKYHLSLIVSFLFSLSIFSQDLIYTISGEKNNKKVPLDSILVENLDNNTWVLFNDIGIQDEYTLNLSENKYLGAQILKSSINDDLFILTKRTQGNLVLTYSKPISSPLKVEIFNINGQKLYSSFNRQINFNNDISINAGGGQILLIRIETDFGSSSFKILGGVHDKEPSVEIYALSRNKISLKQTRLYVSNDFRFTKGDSIRISIFKQNHFAPSIKKEIVQSDRLNFVFEDLIDTLKSVTTGRLLMDEFDGIHVDDVKVISAYGECELKLDGSFNLIDFDSKYEESPLLFMKNDQVLFGYYPHPTSLNQISIDDVLIFYLKLFPDISWYNYTDIVISEGLRNNINYQNLRNELLSSFQNKELLINNTDFEFLLEETVRSFTVDTTSQLKSLSFSDEGKFKFDFSRYGKVSVENDSKLFTKMGVEIRKLENQQVVYQEILDPISVILTFESGLSWAMKKIVETLEYVGNDVDLSTRSFTFKDDGDYIVTFTNGNKGLSTAAFTKKVSEENAELIGFKMLTSAAPVGMSAVLGNEDGAIALAGIMSKLNNSLVNMVGSESFSSSDIPALFIGLSGDLFDLVLAYSDVENLFLKTFFNHAKKFAKLEHKENMANIIFMCRDLMVTRATGRQTRFFYKGYSYSPLTYVPYDSKQIIGAKGNAATYGIRIQEEIISYDIEATLTERIFTPVFENKDAGDLPLKASVIRGDVSIQQPDVVTSAEGYAFFDFTLKDAFYSEVKVQPDFIVDPYFIKPDTLQLWSLVPYWVTIKSGNKQGNVPGEVLDKPLVVQVLDKDRYFIPGVQVEFYTDCEDCGEPYLMPEEGEVDPIAITNKYGQAQMLWKLGENPINQKIKARLLNFKDVPVLTFETVRPIEISGGTGDNSLDFEESYINGDNRRSIRIDNNTLELVTIKEIILPDGFALLESSNLPIQLEPGKSSFPVIMFKPKQVKKYEGIIKVFTDFTNEIVTLPITGYGAQDLIIEGDLNFGTFFTHESSPIRQLKITNNTDGEINLGYGFPYPFKIVSAIGNNLLQPDSAIIFELRVDANVEIEAKEMISITNKNAHNYTITTHLIEAYCNEVFKIQLSNPTVINTENSLYPCKTGPTNLFILECDVNNSDGDIPFNLSTMKFNKIYRGLGGPCSYPWDSFAPNDQRAPRVVSSDSISFPFATSVSESVRIQVSFRDSVTWRTMSNTIEFVIERGVNYP